MLRYFLFLFTRDSNYELIYQSMDWLRAGRSWFSSREEQRPERETDQ